MTLSNLFIRDLIENQTQKKIAAKGRHKTLSYC